MEPLYKIKKGLDIMLEGAAEQQLAACPLAETYAASNTFGIFVPTAQKCHALASA